MALKDDLLPDEVHAKAAHANGKIKRKVYEKELHKLQVELSKQIREFCCAASSPDHGRLARVERGIVVGLAPRAWDACDDHQVIKIDLAGLPHSAAALPACACERPRYRQARCCRRRPEATRQVEIGLEKVEYSLRAGESLLLRHEKEEIYLTRENPVAVRPVSRR